MRKKIGFKPTRRQQIEAFNAADAFMAAAAGVAPKMQQALPKDRAAPVSREGPVLRAVRDLVAIHRKVRWALRVNSGAASYEAASGKWAPVRFHEWITPAKGMRMPDVFGQLMDGRLFAFECKAPGFKEPKGERELEQWAFLYMIQNCGGIGEFISDVEQAARALDQP